MRNEWLCLGYAGKLRGFNPKATASMNTLEFFFDCSSPWTYLAFEAIAPILDEPNVDVVFKPILVGGIFNSVNPSVYENRSKPVPAKARYYAKDLRDWTQASGLTITSPAVFPVNSVKAMRGAFMAIEQGVIVAYARAIFEAYWGRGEDISQDVVLLPLLANLGLNEADFQRYITDADNKQKLFDATDELIKRGGFGSPTMFVNGADMYFGNDRVVLVRRALGLS